jgi:hypothetical protein
LYKSIQQAIEAGRTDFKLNQTVLLIVEKHKDVPSVIANKIIEIYGVKSESVVDPNSTIKPSEEVEVL